MGQAGLLPPLCPTVKQLGRRNFPKTVKLTPPPHTLTVQEVLQAEEFDFLLPLDGVGSCQLHSAGPCPEDFALAEADGIDVLALQLQDEAPVQDIQKLVGVEALLLVGDSLRAGEAHLLQCHRPKELHLLVCGLQVAVEEAAAMGVADGQCCSHQVPTVLELDLQVGHCKEKAAGPWSSLAFAMAISEHPHLWS